MRLDKKIALVSGAAAGIGAAITRTFCRNGAFVFAGDVNRREGEQLAESIRADGGACTFVYLDVSDPASCSAAANEVIERSGRLDVLVNNAGIGHVGTMLSTTGEDLDRLYAVNLRGVFNLSKVFTEGMVERKSGCIINIASIGGVIAIRDRLAYCVTKFGVVGLTKCMALDHARDGIRVNSICPGRVETPFVQARLKEYPDPEKAYEEMSSTQAIGRMGTPEEIADAALYLAGDEAAFITGAELIIDGGWSVGK